MRIVIDIEANALVNPTKIWCIVCKDIDTGEYYIFRKVTENAEEAANFRRLCDRASTIIGHNHLGYDWPVISNLLNIPLPSIDRLCDTLVLSKLIDYSRSGHSIEDYGIEFGLEKGKFTDFSKYSQEMEDYCVRDVDICHKIYSRYHRYISNAQHRASIVLEHKFQLVVNQLSDNGFCFNDNKARRLLETVEKELQVLDKEILEAFPPKLKLIREITPKETKYGTLNRSDFRFIADGNLHEYNGGPFCRCTWSSFNPASHKQIVQTLSDAGWSPVDKTKTHVDADREYQQRKRNKMLEEDFISKYSILKKTGWKVNETNLETLPPRAPKAARLLANRILYESRRRTLVEWLSLVSEDERIHGRFYGIGAWTHRMAHQNPNTANIPNEFDTSGKKKLLGKELRSLWCAPRNRLLVGVDAEGIQLRIFAHYINDPEFTYALVQGRKSDKTDPHSLNQRIIGDVCKTRQAAKRFIYALLLGAGLGKLAEILECTEAEARQALDRILQRYTGWARLKEETFPADARRGWFTGLDGRRVRILGDTDSQRKHLAMSGYLQNGEAVCMKLATLKWVDKLKDYDAKLVNLVHDEWQTECPNNMEIALAIARLQARSLEEVGEDLNLNCPLAGSYYNDDLKDYTIGLNWAYTH